MGPPGPLLTSSSGKGTRPCPGSPVLRALKAASLAAHLWRRTRVRKEPEGYSAITSAPGRQELCASLRIAFIPPFKLRYF